MKSNSRFYQEIASGLNKVFSSRSAVNQLPTIDLKDGDAARYIIFSDQHRGARNGADDFQLSERAYNAALAYYNALGYHLVALGDVEELWEERTADVLAAYAQTLKLERNFHADGRYHRAFGNHDEIWQDPKQVGKLLQPHFGRQPLRVHEGFKLKVEQDGRSLGEFLLVHGHQGTADSDRFAKISKWLVRNLWQPLQRLTKLRVNTPAKDWQLRKKHNLAMYEWARSLTKRLVLITGHTHYPVFESKTHEEQLLEEIAAVNRYVDLTEVEKRERIAPLAAKLEWVRVQQSQGQRAAAEDIAAMKPCYFNTGCCSFADGDITGLEIADGEIRLVRWSSRESQAAPRILAQASLRRVFASLGAAPVPQKVRNSGRVPAAKPVREAVPALG